MNNYATDQWLITQFPCGAGGKFICSLLFLFDQVEHWAGIADPEQQFLHYQHIVSQQLPWLSKEPNTDWDLAFFSRSYERGNNINVDQFNQLVDQHASEHFRNTWASGRKVVDHWHKPHRPAFWQQAQSLVIHPNNNDLLKHLMMTKLFQVDWQRQVFVDLLDAPTTQVSEHNQLYQQQYQNAHEFYFDDLDSFLQQHLDQKVWYNTWQQPYVENYTWSFDITDLVDWTQLIQRWQQVEESFGQTIDRALLKRFHQTWLTHSNL
jgi:hypothetical protein